MDELRLHPQTKKVLKRIVREPSQGYLFVGPIGSGKRSVAEHAAKLWAKDDVGLVHFVEPEGRSIGIDAILALRTLLGRVVPSDRRRTIIIDHAGSMTPEAQNSLLKSLEEPVERTTFILLVEDRGAVLPTISSRLQAIMFYRLSEAELMQWFSSHTGQNLQETTRYIHLGGGTPGGMLQAWKDIDEASEAVELGKQFLQGDHYERSVAAAKLQGSERPVLQAFFVMLGRLLSALLRQEVNNEDYRASSRTAERLELILSCRKLLEQNVNPRLILSRLVLEL